MAETGDEGQAADANAFDAEGWTRRLYDLNPWAEGLEPEEHLPGHWRRDVDGFSGAFTQARLQAALERRGQGGKVWNTWAKAMWALCEELQAAGQWVKNNDKAEASQHLFLQCASVEFDGLCLRGGADFSGFLFPGAISFRQTRFGDKAQYGCCLAGGASVTGQCLCVRRSWRGGGRAPRLRLPLWPGTR